MIDRTRLAVPLLVAGLLGLAACGSTPTQFYTLLPPAAAAPVASAPFQIEVLPVEIPAQVATQQMVVRTGAGEMVPVDTRRWIAPLDQEIRGALSADLSQRLGAPDIYGLSGVAAGASGPRAVPVYRISLKVQRFESALGAYARVDALWTVRRNGDGGLALTCASSESQTVPPGYDAMAQGHQQALAALAQRIAAGVGALQQGQTACPAG
jgi:uncharacterized lipoprotein YmbA